MADSFKGFIYKFNTETLKATVYFDHETLKPQSVFGVAFGVNGIKFSQGHLYFSNTNQQFIARIKATGKEQQLTGTPEIVASQTPADDFTVDNHNGDLYIAQQIPVKTIGFFSHDRYGSTPKTIAGGPDSKDFVGSTAIAWAKSKHGRRPQHARREPRTLLVTIAGDFAQFHTGNFTGGGKPGMLHLDEC